MNSRNGRQFEPFSYLLKRRGVTIFCAIFFYKLVNLFLLRRYHIFSIKDSYRKLTESYPQPSCRRDFKMRHAVARPPVSHLSHFVLKKLHTNVSFLCNFCNFLSRQRYENGTRNTLL